MRNYNIEGEEKFIAGQYTGEKEFWLSKLCGDLVKTGFPYDLERSGKSQRQMASLSFGFPSPLESKLITASNHSDYRLHMILVAGLVQLLNKYTGNEDIIIGIPIYKQELEGEFVNTVLTLRIRLAAHMTFKDLLLQVRETITQANEHANYPIEIIPHDLGLDYNPEEDFPLFDMVLLLENIHDKSYIKHIHTNLVFFFSRSAENLEGVVEYNSYLYKPAAVEKIIGYFNYLLQEALFNPNLAIAAISPLTGDEKKRLLLDFNDTAAPYPGDMTVARLFASQVQKTPDYIALVHDHQQLTYKQLNSTANFLAALLIEKGLKINTIVAVMGKRSIGIAAAILGILKARGIYLPINARDPQARICFILEDSKAAVLITQKHLVENNPSYLGVDSLEHILFSGDLTGVPGEKGLHPEVSGQPGDPIYTIYTSGTTGKPKGVLVNHRSVVNYICWAAKIYVDNQRVNFPLYTSIAFDLTMTSLFTPLITGNAVVVYEGEGNQALIEQVVADNRVGVVKLTPSQLELICAGNRTGRISSIKRLVLGGEALETRWAKKVHETFNGKIEIYNEYGPTETTVGSMIYQLDPRQDHGRWVPIGKPAANTQIYLLNENQEPIPGGAVGEIYISGHGVACGYLNRPQLTSEKFKIYRSDISFKTGDLARWLPDDNIQFLGRKDEQVKIRGFRVESGEIESYLLTHEEINQAVVMAREDQGGNSYLCAYIVSHRELSVSELREYLFPKLPDYMIPAYFVKIDQIPLTSNAKVDKKALPEPRLDIDEVIPARNHREQEMAKIWSEILYIPETDLSIDLNFFDSGGHSLSATLLMAKIHKKFNINLRLVDIFERPTIRGLCEYFTQAVKDIFVPIEPVEKKEYYELSPAQERLYIVKQLDNETTSYNVPIIRTLEGNLDRARLEDVFNRLIVRHESLRTSFELTGNKAVQKVHEAVNFKVQYHDSSKGHQQQIIEGFVRPFDLAKAPLLRVELLIISESKQILMVDMHHIVTDKISMEILVRDFMALYKGEELSTLKLQYKDYSLWQHSDREKEKLHRQEKYWLKEFVGDIPVLNLQVDHARPFPRSFAGSSFYFDIGEEETVQLNSLAAANGATLFMVFLALYNVFLSRLSGQKDIVVGTAVDGRRHDDLQLILGMFINTLSLRNFPLQEKTFGEFLKEVKIRTLEAFENQDYQFEDLVEKVVPHRNPSRNPIFDVMILFEDHTPEVNPLGIDIKPYDYENPVSKFDLTLWVFELETTIRFRMEYCTDIFEKETIQWFSSYFKEMMTEVLNNPDKKLAEIGKMPERERKKKLVQFTEDLEME